MKNSFPISRATFGYRLFAALLSLLMASLVVGTPPAVPEGEALRRAAAGKWKFEVDTEGLKGTGVTEYKADGTLNCTGAFEMAGKKVAINVEGKWWIDGSKLIWEVTKTNDPEMFAVGQKSSEQILAIDAKTLRYRDENGVIWEEKRLSE